MAKKNLRIVDIAKLAKVSAGTVDRVIHSRGLVSEEKQERVEKILKEYSYKPNVAARFLASRKTFKFAMAIPTFQSGEYWELVQLGAEKAEAELSDFSVSIDYLYFDQFNAKSFKQLIPKIEKGNYDGVIIATLYKEMVIDLSKILDTKKTPYIFIDSNIPACNNLSYYGTDSYTSGVIAAKLMLTLLKEGDKIVIVHPIYENHVISTQIENRERGFLKYLEQNSFKGKIENVVIDPTRNNISQLEKMISVSENMGVITFNSRIYEVVNIINNLKINFDKIHMIGYDSIERNLDALKNDRLKYLISQRSGQQGYDSVKALSNYLIFDLDPARENFMSIDILIKENTPFYTN